MGVCHERTGPRFHSQETKDLISQIRIAYLQANPDKVPWKLNHSSKQSYPEKYFEDVFKNEGMKLEPYLPLGIYELDFADQTRK